MMLDGIGLFRGIMAKMDWLDQNQRIISENVANSDTPGYQPKVLKDRDFGSILGDSLKARDTGNAQAHLRMTATDAGHFGAPKSAAMQGPAAVETQRKAAYEASPDNNGVVLEEQLFKANENATNYQLATNLYRRNVGMLRMVIQGVR